jgi:hypothetical protein
VVGVAPNVARLLDGSLWAPLTSIARMNVGDSIFCELLVG